MLFSIESTAEIAIIVLLLLLLLSVQQLYSIRILHKKFKMYYADYQYFGINRSLDEYNLIDPYVV